jgi:hypothetical protein
MKYDRTFAPGRPVARGRVGVPTSAPDVRGSGRGPACSSVPPWENLPSTPTPIRTGPTRLQPHRPDARHAKRAGQPSCPKCPAQAHRRVTSTPARPAAQHRGARTHRTGGARGSGLNRAGRECKSSGPRGAGASRRPRTRRWPRGARPRRPARRAPAASVRVPGVRSPRPGARS